VGGRSAPFGVLMSSKDDCTQCTCAHARPETQNPLVSVIISLFQTQIELTDFLAEEQRHHLHALIIIGGKIAFSSNKIYIQKEWQ
jgi:hypothetical protein